MDVQEVADSKGIILYGDIEDVLLDKLTGNLEKLEAVEATDEQASAPRVYRPCCLCLLQKTEEEQKNGDEKMNAAMYHIVVNA